MKKKDERRVTWVSGHAKKSVRLLLSNSNPERLRQRAKRSKLKPKNGLKEKCLIWSKSCGKNGYAVFCLAGGERVQIAAHTAAWIIYHKKPVPEGLQVCHHCDKPSCTERTHLYVGTPSQNMTDSKNRRRHVAGERHPFSKLNYKKAKAIRAKWKKGVLGRVLAKLFDVDRSTISYVVTGRTWSEKGAPPTLIEFRSLTKKQVREICVLLKKGILSQREIAKNYKVCLSTIVRIRRFYRSNTGG